MMSLSFELCRLQCTVHSLVRMFIYMALIIAGLCVSIPTSVTSSEASGICLLSASIKWDTEVESDKYLLRLDSHGSGTCNFVVYFSVIACIALPLGILGYLVYRVHGGTLKEIAYGSGAVAMVMLLVQSITSVVAFAAACVLSAGLGTFCRHLMKDADGEKYRTAGNITSCRDWQGYMSELSAQGNTSWHYGISNFYDYLYVAEVSNWIVMLLWVAIVVHGFVAICMYRRGAAKSEERQNIGNIQPTA